MCARKELTLTIQKPEAVTRTVTIRLDPKDPAAFLIRAFIGAVIAAPILILMIKGAHVSVL